MQNNTQSKISQKLRLFSRGMKLQKIAYEIQNLKPQNQDSDSLNVNPGKKESVPNSYKILPDLDKILPDLDKILPDLDKISGVKILEQNLVRSYKNSKHLVTSDKILIRFFSWEDSS